MALRGPCAILNLLHIRGGLVIMTRESSKTGDSRRYEEALAAYEQAISLDPNDAWTQRQKSQVLIKLERYEEALPALDQAIHLDPNDALAFREKGYALSELKRYKEALEALDQAILLDPND